MLARIGFLLAFRGVALSTLLSFRARCRALIAGPRAAPVARLLAALARLARGLLLLAGFTAGFAAARLVGFASALLARAMAAGAIVSLLPRGLAGALLAAAAVVAR